MKPNSDSPFHLFPLSPFHSRQRGRGEKGQRGLLFLVTCLILVITGCSSTSAQKPAWVARRHALVETWGMWPNYSQAPGVIRYLQDQNPRMVSDNYIYDTPDMYLFHGGLQNWTPSSEDRSRKLAR